MLARVKLRETGEGHLCPAIVEDMFIFSLCLQEKPRVRGRKTSRGLSSRGVYARACQAVLHENQSTRSDDALR